MVLINTVEYEIEYFNGYVLLWISDYNYPINFIYMVVEFLIITVIFISFRVFLKKAKSIVTHKDKLFDSDSTTWDLKTDKYIIAKKNKIIIN